MGVIKLAAKKPVTTSMLMLLVLILGVTSLSRLPLDLLPAMEIPYAVVSTSYSGVGPEEMETLVTSPIESAIATVGGIKNLTSTTREGNSLVIAEFVFGTDMNFAALEMREKLDLIKGMLPSDASTPMVLKIDPSAMPIIQLSVAGEDLQALQDFAEDVLKPRLERIDGIASVSVSGGFTQQVDVIVNQEKLLGHGLTMDQVAQVLGAENLNLPGGKARLGYDDLTTRTVGQFASLEEMRLMPITLRSGGVITLGEVAEVVLATPAQTTISRVNGVHSIDVSVQKQSATNTVNVAALVRAELDKLGQEYPTTTIHMVMDQSEFIRLSISNLTQNALHGALLAILMLFIFFRSFRTTLVIAISIPISIIATFILMFYSGVTLNMMTLGGFALAVGMLVDNSIVVLENVYRFMEEGHSRFDAAVKGAAEVAMSITGSTLTTIAVFVPIVFVEGITSMIFKELALTTAMALIVSLVVALTVVPMLSAQLLKVTEKTKDVKSVTGVRKVFARFDVMFDKVLLGYRRLLRWSMANRKKTLLAGFLIFIVCMGSMLSLGAEFLPAMDEGMFSVSIRLPTGYDLKETTRVTLPIEELLLTLPEVESVSTTIGSGGNMGLSASSANRATISVQLVGRGERTRSTVQIADFVRESLVDVAGARIEVTVTQATMGGGLGGSAISISLKGKDIETLEHLSNVFIETISSVEGTREVRSNLSSAHPEIQIRVNRLAAAQYGMTSAQVANTVRTNLSGRTATRYRHGGSEINVVVRGDKRYADNAELLEQMLVSTPTGANVPLGQLATISVATGPITINRDGQARSITITGDIAGRDMRSVSRDIAASLSELHIPDGYIYTIGGQNQEMMTSFMQLGLALLLAIVLVYVILAAQFEALLQPFTIITAVPLSFSGGALLLFLTRKPISVTALIGAIILAGIVVNDAIVLIDYIDTRRKMGESREEAIENAGPIRLRPIVITTLTTVLGLIPMALGLGEGGETLAPMALVVIGGLSMATLLTLVIVPSIYTLFDDIHLWIAKKLGRTDKEVVSHGA